MFQPLFIDGFAGGGGASTGIEQAIGRSVDHAINHSPLALAIHKANHPTTEHHCTDIRRPFLPRAVTGGRRVGGMWMSPDCKEFSKAKGGPLKDRSIRTLADEIPHWIEQTEPEVVYVENVEEFEDWGPLEEVEEGKWRVIIDRKGEDFKKWLRKCRRLGYRIDHRTLRACDYGAPTSRRRLYVVMRRDKRPIVWPKPTHGKPGSPGVLSGKLLPYRTAAECIDWSIPCPSIFSRVRPLKDATLRRIAHGVMRYVVNAAHPFIVPVTHSQNSPRTHSVLDPLRTITTANGGEFAVSDVELAPHITKFHSGSVGSPMDKEMPTVTSNGEPARPAGAMPLGIVAGTLAPLQNGERRPGEKPREQSLEDPFSTIATGGKFAAIGATMAQIGWGEREGQDPRSLDAQKPLGTIMADGNKHAAVSAFLSRYYGSDKTNAGGDLEGQIPVVRAGGQHHAVVCAHMEQANTGMVGHDMRKPVSTIVGKGSTQRVVETTLIEEGTLPPEMMDRAVRTAAFLVKYYGTDSDNEVSQIQAVDRPMDTVTTKARFAVVTVTIDAITYVIVDIGLRMLKPRELARAQGFPDSYVLDPIVRKFIRGKWVDARLTIAEQISAIGNSVCPPVARALVAANQPGLEHMKMAA
jgi:DNA (cytosine-5)-methyltransferase 1